MASYTYKFNKESAQQEKMLGLEQDFTERMWNQTNDWNLAQWNRENEYNSPAAQMERFALAGINPNNAAAAIAGNDSAAGSTQASPVGSPSAPSAPSPTGTDLAQQIMGIGGTAIDSVKTAVDAYKTIKAEMPNISADTQNKQADTNLKNEQALTEQKDRERLIEEIRGMKFDNVFIKPATLDNIRANNNLTVAKMDEARQNIENMKGELDLMDKKKTEIDANIAYLKSQKEYWEEAAKTAVSEQARNYAQARAADASAAYSAALKEQADEDTRGKRIQNNINQELVDLGYDPNEHDTKNLLGKQTSVNNARAAKKEFKENLGKNHLKWVDHGDGTGHAEHIITGRIIPVDDKGIPKSKGKGSTNYVRYNSNNHTNPTFHRTTAD